MAEPEDDVLMREIEEELRHEQAQKLWKAYGKYVIGVALAVVLVVAGYQGWQAYDRSQRQDSTSRLMGASSLAGSGDTEAAIEVLGKLENEASGGVKLLARIRKAGLLGKQGDAAGAAAAYQTIANDSAAPDSFRDLARILGSIQLLNADSANAEEVISQLQPLTDAKSPWRHTAREVSAIAALQLGRKDEATEHLQAIALDAQAPGGVRSRAQELLQTID